jgi:hypothetical protein
MVYDIDMHELNLRPFKDLKFLDEISFKKMCFFHFWTINAQYLFFKVKNHYHIKVEEIL